MVSSKQMHRYNRNTWQFIAKNTHGVQEVKYEVNIAIDDIN